MGIAVSTVYYSGDTYNTTDQANYAAALASLTGNGGIALVAPDQATIASHYAGFCATIVGAVTAALGAHDRERRRLADTHRTDLDQTGAERVRQRDGVAGDQSRADDIRHAGKASP